MNPSRKRTRSAGWVAALICVAAFSIVTAVRHLGWLQYYEFRAFDLFTNWLPRDSQPDPRIVLLDVTEPDIRSEYLNAWPPPDAVLARLLEALLARQPRLIGLDVYRDVPVPATGEGIAQLNNVLATNANIICIWRYGATPDEATPPPPAVRGDRSRFGFADFPLDDGVDRKVRRNYLYGGAEFESFSYQLAAAYLEQDGIVPEADADDVYHVRLGKTTFLPLEPNDGSYVRADTGGYQFLMDFRGPRHFERYTLSDALGGRIPEGALRDKIVMIGTATMSVKDFLSTPLEDNLWGNDVHAHAVNQLLRAALDGDQPMRFLRDWQEDGWTLCGALLGGLIGYWLRSAWRFAICVAVGMLALGAVAWLAFRAGWWMPVVPPILTCFAAAAIVVSHASYRENADRIQLMNLFKKHVSSDVAQKIWDERDLILDGDRLRSQKMTATVMFVDLKGFTSIAEKREAQVVMDWLNAYMDAMARTIMANGGVIEKFLGDGLMAVFGIPFARTNDQEVRNDAANAVRCALAMEDELKRLNVDWDRKGWPTTGMRVGIYTGPVVAGSIGSAERMDYTVFGNTVNVASRLESFDKRAARPEYGNGPCRILIGEATHQLLDPEFETLLVGETILDGQKDRTTIYRVVKRNNHHEQTTKHV